MIYICVLCGFVYEQAQGEPKSGITAGTCWDDVPDEWRCSECGAPKEDFDEIPTVSIGLSKVDD